MEDLKQVLEQRLHQIKERITTMEENMNKETSSEEVMITNAFEDIMNERSTEKHDKVTATH